MIERHQDYILTVASLPAGGLTQVPLKLDTDAPFALRLVRSRNVGLNGWRFTNPTGAYQSNALRTDWVTPVQSSGIAYPSRGSVIWEEMIYPSGGTIMVDIGNATNEPITNAQVLFRGSKLFQDGGAWAPSYPDKMSVYPASYQVVVPSLGISQQILNNQLPIKNDADFVYRAGACDPYSLTGAPGSFTNVYVKLRDERGKAYSNDWIHVNDLFGQGLPNPFQTGSSNDDQVLFTPGLLTPEIYLPRRHSMYFDVMRNDSSGSAVNLYFRFVGMKAFPR